MKRCDNAEATLYCTVVHHLQSICRLVRWYTPIIPALWSQRQRDPKFEISMGYLEYDTNKQRFLPDVSESKRFLHKQGLVWWNHYSTRKGHGWLGRVEITSLHRLS
jgi:hypothetical protein